MQVQDRKQPLLQAKIAVALQDEFGRVPTEEEIEHVFHLIRVWKTVLGLHHKRKEQKKSGQLAILSLRPMLIGYARISTTDQTLVKRNPLLDDFRRRASKARVGWTIYSLATPEPESKAGASPFRPRLRLPSGKAAWCLNVTGPAWKGNRKRTAGQCAFMANRWGIGSVNVTL